MTNSILGISLESLYSKVVETSTEGIICVKPDGHFALANDAFCRLVGYERETLFREKKLTDLFTPETLADYQSKKAKRLAGELREQYEVVFIHGQTGAPVYTLSCVSPIHGYKNEFLFSMGIITNITPIKLMQMEHDKSIRKLKKAKAVARLGFWEHDVVKDEFWFSDELLHILGSSRAQAPAGAAHLLAKIHAQDLPTLIELKDRAYKLGEPYTFQYRLHKSENEMIYVHSIAEVEKDKDGRVVRLLGVIQDVTERALREIVINEQRARILSSSKLSALGEMAGGMAHEINTPLAIIRMRVEQLLELQTEGQLNEEILREALDTIDLTTTRISKIINGLRSFSRHGDNDPFARTSIREIIEGTLSFCREKFNSHGVRIEVAGFDHELAVDCQMTQVSQVLLNLLNNAFDAVEKHEGPWVRLEVRSTAGFIEVLVIDSGPGIAQDVAEKIFQPFFTTKEIGKGTGLGLSISKGLMESQRGQIMVDSESKNTCFVLRFPKPTSAANRQTG